MFSEDLKKHLESYCQEIDAEIRRRVRAAGGGRTFDLDYYRLLGSLETLLIAADAICFSLLVHDSQKEVKL